MSAITYVFQFATSSVLPTKVHQTVLIFHINEPFSYIRRHCRSRECHLTRPELDNATWFPSCSSPVTKQSHDGYQKKRITENLKAPFTRNVSVYLRIHTDILTTPILGSGSASVNYYQVHF